MLTRSERTLFRNLERGILSVDSILHLPCEEPTTILCYAISLQREEWVNYLVNNGADVNLGVAGNTPLTEAIMCTNFQAFRQIMAKLMAPRAGYPELKFECSSQGRSLIQELISFEQDEEYLWFLVQNKFDINTRSKDITDVEGALCRLTDYTPFLHCVHKRNFDLARRLCKHGADPNITGILITYHRKYIVHSLELICFHTQNSPAQRLLDVRKVLEMKANVDHTDSRGMSCLHMAAEREWGDLSQLLIQFGANVNIRSKKSHRHATAMEFAETPQGITAIWTSVCARRLAFCMITHKRVGCSFGQNLPGDVVRQIVRKYL